MRHITSIAELHAALAPVRGAGQRVALVPTMGFLHEGHASLAHEARRHADVVVMSSFVNPLQFGPDEDFDKYPRDARRDHGVATEAGVDLLWAPTGADVYPAPPEITVHPGPVGGILEGAIRPGHFGGVLTVVLKLFAVAAPDVAVFGRKDAQQAFLVRRMVADFNLPVRIVVAPTMRESDGLALSSRNVYLDETMRRQAAALPRALEAGVAAFRGGARKAGDVVAATWKSLSTEPGLTAEYLNVVDAETFHPNHAATPSSYLVAAVRVGTKRLLDNVVLGDGLEADPRRPAREHAHTA